MSDPNTSTDPLRIHEATDAQRQVVLHPENDDLFVQTGKQVIEACRLNISLDLWKHEVRAMFDHIRKWAADHADRVQACYISPRHTKLLLYVAPRGEAFDFDLADELVQLNRTLLRKFQVGLIEVLQVPLSEIGRFVHPDEARELYAHA